MKRLGFTQNTSASDFERRRSIDQSINLRKFARNHQIRLNFLKEALRLYLSARINFQEKDREGQRKRDKQKIPEFSTTMKDDHQKIEK
jgi:hypothetical protein